MVLGLSDTHALVSIDTDERIPNRFTISFGDMENLSNARVCSVSSKRTGRHVFLCRADTRSIA